MSRRKKNGQLVQVSAPQTVGEGRASRAKDARPIPLRRLDGEEGALAKLVFALADPALFGEDGSAKLKAQERVRVARKRVRSALGDEQQARQVFALASVSAGERRILATAHPTLAPHLVEQSVAAMRTMREFDVESWTARSEVAVAGRLLATGLAILDQGSSSLDPETCKAAASLIGQAQRMRDNALDTDRRAKSAAVPTFPWLNAPPQPVADEEPDDQQRDEDAPAVNVEPAQPDDDDDDDDEDEDEDESAPEPRGPISAPRETPDHVRAPGARLCNPRLVYDHATGSWRAADVRPARPSPSSVAEMKRRGIDVSQWERES